MRMRRRGSRLRVRKRGDRQRRGTTVQKPRATNENQGTGVTETNNNLHTCRTTYIP